MMGDREAWHAAVNWVTKSWTWLSDWTTTTRASVQFSRVQLLVTPWTAARQASLSITNSWSLLKLMSIESVMPSNHLILCHTLLLPPSIFPSIRASYEEKAQSFHAPYRHVFSIPEALQTPSFGGYMGALLDRHSWLKYCPLVTELSL